MTTIWIAILLLWTGAVSWWNARVCGSAWDAADGIGGWGRLVMWCAAIQSAIGFTLLILFGEAGLTALFVPAIGAKLAHHMLAIGYLLIIVPAVGTGLVLTVHSWIEAWKKRDFASIGTAAYNTLAQANNMAGMGSGIERGMAALGDLFKQDDDQPSWVVPLVLGAVVVSLFGGVLTTYGLIQHYRSHMSLLDSLDKA